MVSSSSSHPLQSSPSESASLAKTEALNWRTCWYPITFAVDLPVNQPYGFSIFSEPFVVFRDGAGALICLHDRCPHRLAKLSDGQIIEGTLECLYHGWQFGQDGICLHIPQLAKGAEIPARSQIKSFPTKVQQGMVWVWADATVPPDEAPHVVSELDSEGVFKVDTATDFPFDYMVLLENLLDPAHVYISHDRTELKIRREDATPLTMEVLSSTLGGIEGRYRRANNPQAPWTAITFHAPTLVHYSFSNPAYGIIGGFALYALPMSYGRSRILARRYGNFFKRSFTLKPRWLEHLRQNKIFEEDLPLIAEQDRFFQQTGQSLKSAYLPLKTCDTFVMEQRRWLDRFGQDLPWYVGFATTKLPDEGLRQTTELPATRFERHTQHCQDCRRTDQWLSQVKQGGQVGAIASLALALISDGRWQIGFTLAFVGATLATAAAERLRTHFEATFSHDRFCRTVAGANAHDSTTS